MYPSPLRKVPSPTSASPGGAPHVAGGKHPPSPLGLQQHQNQEEHGDGDDNNFLEARHVLNKDIVLQRKLGNGAMGEAWLAFCPTKAYPSPLVIKTICVPSDDALDRALREVNALRQLSHPHIVKYYNAWLEEGPMFRGSLCIAMEYCEYGDMRTLIHHQSKVQQQQQQQGQKNQGQGFFTNDQVMAYAAQIISAVAHCHSVKVVHRDLKPENILLTRRSPTEPVVALLADFGLARDLNSTFLVSRVGTPNYLSPEIARGESYTMKTDIWAVGVILYELMALTRPFSVPKTNPPLDQDKYLRAIVLRILNDDPIPQLRETALNVFSPSLVNMVIACLRKKERDRPSAVELTTTVSKTFAKFLRDNGYLTPQQTAAANGNEALVRASPIRRPTSPLPSGRPAAAGAGIGVPPQAPRPTSPLPVAGMFDRQPSPIRTPQRPIGSNQIAGSNNRPSPPSAAASSPTWR